MSYNIDYYCISDTGLRRSMNQDNFICQGEPTQNTPLSHLRVHGNADSKAPAVFGVFDGMGGEECGEVASHIAVSTLADSHFGFFKRRGLAKYVKRANSAICRYVSANGLTCMGTTAAILLFSGRKGYLCNLGDSRIYSVMPDGLTQLSVDHSAPCIYGMKPPLYQHLGIPKTEMKLSPHIRRFDCRAGDIYLICSDGLTDMVSEETIHKVITTAPGESAAEELLRLALEGSGVDNVTVMLLYLS